MLQENKYKTMKIAFSDLLGKKLALLIWYYNEAAEPTAAIINGTAFLHEGKMALKRTDLLPPMIIPVPLIWRAKVVPPELHDILKTADFCIQARADELGWGKKAMQKNSMQA